jgi:hypothetical protein
MKPSSEPVHTIQADFHKERRWLRRVRGVVAQPLFWPILTAALLIALLILSGYAWTVHRERGIALLQAKDFQADLATLQAEYEDLQTLTDGIYQQLVERENQLALFANAMRVIALEGTEDAPEARGTFYSGAVTGVLVLEDLPALSTNEVYQLWLIPSDGEPVAAGLVRVEERGATMIKIDMDGKAQDFAAVGVSIEPAGGSPQPTGTIVLLGTVNVAGGR